MAKIAIPQAKNGVARQNAEKTNAFNWAEVEKLAYQFFVDRGHEHGHHEEDWIRAEKIVRSRSKQ